MCQGHKSKSKSDYFGDKFIMSLKIQYGCRLKNVSGRGRERDKAQQVLFNESVHTESSAHIIWFLRSSLKEKPVLYRVFIKAKYWNAMKN